MFTNIIYGSACAYCRFTLYIVLILYISLESKNTYFCEYTADETFQQDFLKISEVSASKFLEIYTANRLLVDCMDYKIGPD